MSNNTHGLTAKDEYGRTKAHPLYWVWHEKRKRYFMEQPWWGSVVTFVTWAEDNGWKPSDNIRRRDVKKGFSAENCYVHVRGTPLGQAK